ncbi:MAG: outer membrane protein transport protein [Polyangiaceae bacterium]|nr:outer membrane protein transport protein [Polyangiaceae bacterium]
MRFRSALASLGAAAVLGASLPARATDVQDFPDTGTEPLGRSGAWVARASSPLATLQNPAGLAGQQTGVLANVHLVLNKVCFQRQGDGERIRVGQNGLRYPEVCNENKGTPSVLPAVAGVLRASERFGLGLSVAPPNVYGALRFPETVRIRNDQGAKPELPSPQRYMLLEQDGIALNTTVSAGFEAAKGFRVGLGFVWGFASYTLANANMSLSPSPVNGVYQDPVTEDVRAELSVADWFIPGATFGMLYSPTRNLDLGVNVFMQAAFDAHGDLALKANYWTNNGTADDPDVTDSSKVEKGLGHFRMANPLEARLGARFHQPRHSRATPGGVRDPLADDLFDLELDVSYSKNSDYDRGQLRFPASPAVPVKGTANGAVVPENNDIDFRVKRDSVGVRLGGDWVVVPARVAVRAGGFWEPNVQNDEYANVSFLASQRVGLSVGGTYRLAMVDLEAGYMHVFFSEIDNGDRGKLLVVSGDANASPPFRSPYGINSGRFRQSVNVFSVGATARF